MTRTVTIECDRCGTVEDAEDADDSDDWVVLKEHRVEDPDSWDLCFPCRTDLRDLITTPPTITGPSND